MSQRKSIYELELIVRKLTGQDGCPWDKDQTHESLKRHLLEECYEFLEAIDKGDPANLLDEAGDILTQIIFHADMARRENKFDLGDVIDYVARKLIRRHPHIFGDVEVADKQEVETNWELIKEQERGSRSAVVGIPNQAPALVYAQLMQDRVGKDGFDWTQIGGVLAKLSEEIEEFTRAENQLEKSAEFGDLLFTLVNFARWQDINAEDSLRQANNRFKKRYMIMERLSRELGQSFKELSIVDKQNLWNEAKLLDN
jgi:tetrapyrrole methylase family protein/MazG family protein